jgi:hypothetical protein
MRCEEGGNEVWLRCEWGVTWSGFTLDPVGMRSQDMRDRDAASVSARGVDGV